MYINPFVAGILATLLFEAGITLLLAFYLAHRGKDDE